MKAWCEHCGKYVDSEKEVSRLESLEIKGVSFKALQSFCVCPVCGEEVMPQALVDQNIHKAHNAYRRALNSITAEEIQSILDRYDIGAQPLGVLLGWGPNTIGRQLKHTIPDPEHAMRLKALRDPGYMMKLLKQHGNRLKPAARKKALAATQKQLQMGTSPALGALSLFVQNYVSTLDGVKTIIVDHKNVEFGKGELQCSGSAKKANGMYEFAFAGRKI